MVNILNNVVVAFKAVDKGLSSTFDKLKRNAKSMNVVFSANNKQFGDMHTKTGQLNRRMKNLNTTGARFANRFRLATAGLRGFRMEMLGVMFFGMAMKNLFTNLLRPALEVFGVFELWTVTLQTLFLPIMEKIFPYLLSMMEWFINLPEPVKLATGAITLLGVALGTLLFIVGTLVLGFGSLAAGGIATVLAIAGPIAVVGAAVTGFFLLFETNFLGIKTILTELGTIIVTTFVNNWLRFFKMAKGSVDTLTKAFQALKLAIKAALTFDTTALGKLGAFIFGTKQETPTIFAETPTSSPSIGDLLQQIDNIGQGGSGVNITNNFNGFTDQQLAASLDERDQSLVDTITRNAAR